MKTFKQIIRYNLLNLGIQHFNILRVEPKLISYRVNIYSKRNTKETVGDQEDLFQGYGVERRRVRFKIVIPLEDRMLSILEVTFYMDQTFLWCRDGIDSMGKVAKCEIYSSY